MPSEEKDTENEHYIPRMYLREFSEIKKKGKKEKAYIWQYNLETMMQIPDQVDVKSICFEKNLYEFRNADGTFVARNKIEGTFANIEAAVSKVISSIKQRIQEDKYLDCTTFLSEEEKSLLNIFITSLMYRDPATMEKGTGYLKKANPDLSDIQARNFTLLNLLPFGMNSEWDQQTMIRTALENLCGMAFQVGVANSDVIFTSDRPFVQWPSHSKEYPNRPKALVFPLTSRLVLYLYPLEDVDKTGWNCAFQLDEERIRDVQNNIAVCARKWIYSREKLTNEQLEIIKEARNGIK